jgi:ankyrin repeat protein
LLACTARDRFGRTPVFWAAFYGNMDLLQHILDSIFTLSFQHQEEIQQRQQMRTLQDALFQKACPDTWFPVHTAAKWGNVQCLAFLLEHVPDMKTAVFKVYDKYGFTPAHLAASWGHVDTLDFIVRHAPTGGVEVLEAKQHSRLTPLDLAVAYGEHRMMEYIRRLQSTMLPSLSSSSITGPSWYP